MPRQWRVEQEGAIDHVMNRGDRREPIFLGDDDRRRFLETSGQTCQKRGWQVQAYGLMNKYFHLAVETPSPPGILHVADSGKALRANTIVPLRGKLKQSVNWSNSSPTRL